MPILVYSGEMNVVVENLLYDKVLSAIAQSSR